MKILMLNPPAENTLIEFPDEKGKAYIETEDFGCFPPLGLLYVLSYLEKHAPGHQLYFKDCVAERISYQGLESLIDEIQPDVVGITSFTLSLVDVCYTAKTVRKAAPHAHICLGGHHTIAFPFQAAALKEFNSIIVGEGEIPFTELVKTLEKKGDITQIPGVYTFESIRKWSGEHYQDKRFLGHITVPAGYNTDIDILPAPNRSYISHINYRSIVGKTGKLATIITSRGCPYKCTFCDVPYKIYRNRSVQSVMDEIEECLKMGYQEFHFYDDLFNITPGKVIEFCKEIERRGLKFAWDFRGRVNTVTRESLEAAKKAGCRMVSFGVETGSDEGLKVLEKGITVKKIREVFQWCRELKIKTIADFMIGLPSEKTKEDVLSNIDFLIELNPDYAQVGVLCLYPHTELFHQAVKKGLIEDNRWEGFSLEPTTNFTIDHWEEFLSTGELVELQKKAYKKYYLRPSYILKNVSSLESMYEFTTKIKGFFKLFS